MLRWVSRVFAVVGILILVWVGWSYFYGEPFTGWLAHRRQEAALSLYEHQARGYHAPRHRGRQKGVQCLLRARQYHVPIGKPYALITIPRLGLDRTVVMQGTEDVASELETGPGHYPNTANPCSGKTVAIAGHRTTYGAWFRHIDDLRPGDRIYLRLPYGRFVYEVTGHKVVEPNDWSIIFHDHKLIAGNRLVLSACNPPYSAAQRYIVFARNVTKV